MMKFKKIALVGFSATLAVAGATALALQKQQKFERADAETEINHYMPFESNFNVDDYGDYGTVKDVDATTWSGRYNALDCYFTWAGNADNAVEIRKVSDPDAATPVARITNDQFNGNCMVVNYIQIDTSTLTEGEQLFLRLCDNSTNGYGFNTFGYLHVNASATNVSDAIWAHINTLTVAYDAGNSEANFRVRETMNFYLNGKASNDSILALSSNKNLSANEDFEDNGLFLQRWYRDTSYDSPEGLGEYYKSWSTMISGADHHWNNNNMPFNKTGDHFFKGYHEDSTGFIDTDNARYRFVSKPFILSGTGFISIKMAGRPASLHVLRGNTELAFIDIKTCNLSGDAANITTGFNSCTMVRHVINLGAFLGQPIQIAIADVDTNGNWGAVNYDELITKYDADPFFKVDEAIQNSIHNYYLDKYVSRANSDIIYVDSATRDANPSDSSNVKAAHDFLDFYYSNFRATGTRFSFCSLADNTLYGDLVSRYNALSKEAQAVVDLSEDFDFGDNRTDGNWYDYSLRSEYTVGEIVRYVAAKWGIAIDVKNNSGLASNVVTKNAATTIAIIVVISAVALIGSAVLVFLRLKKKKEN